jgi:hypothetical protein
MALTNEQKALLDAMYDGSAAMQSLFTSLGTEGTFSLLREWAAERGVTEATAGLASAGTLSNVNWTVIDAVTAAGVPSAAISGLLAAVVAKLEAHDTTGLFPLLLAHALSDKTLRGL